MVVFAFVVVEDVVGGLNGDGYVISHDDVAYADGEFRREAVVFRHPGDIVLDGIDEALDVEIVVGLDDYDEFVPSVTGRFVAAVEELTGICDAGGDKFQGPVPFRMAVGIIYGLEIIDVRHKEVVRCPALYITRNLFQVFDEEALVGKPGQGLHADLPLDVAQEEIEGPAGKADIVDRHLGPEVLEST